MHLPDSVAVYIASTHTSHQAIFDHRLTSLKQRVTEAFSNKRLNEIVVLPLYVSWLQNKWHPVHITSLLKWSSETVAYGASWKNKDTGYKMRSVARVVNISAQLQHNYNKLKIRRKKHRSRNCCQSTTFVLFCASKCWYYMDNIYYLSGNAEN